MATEQHLRQQLAAAYRLAALFGWRIPSTLTSPCACPATASRVF
ncbi:Uncharacterised protein [Klebsiella pneumoniae]|nr:Uncharacterised protein [Klebsiella pneumoniae]